MFGTLSSQLFIPGAFPSISPPCPEVAWGTEPPDPYGEGTELSQEHPFLFVLGTTGGLEL